MATRGPHHGWDQVKKNDFGRSRLLENAFLSMWFASLHQCKYGWYLVNITSKLKTNINL